MTHWRTTSAQRLFASLAVGVACVWSLRLARTDEPRGRVFLPEQRCIEIGAHSRLSWIAPNSTNSTKPRTVSDPQTETPEWKLGLDDAIRIALENANVIRVLTGLSASSSGRTIYDPAISNTEIDQQRALFDPVVGWQGTSNRVETPFAVVDPFDVSRSQITGNRSDDFRSTFSVVKRNLTGARFDLAWNEDPTRVVGPGLFVLNPQNRNSVELGYTHPLLQGAGYRVNQAPIVIARINTSRSFFQFKDTVQEMVRGVIEGYWQLIAARTDLWARRIQMEQAEEAYKREKARMEIAGFSDLADVSQVRVTYQTFKANFIASQATVLDREAALRNILGLPPNDNRTIIPVTAMPADRLRPEWESLVRLAEENRPDLIELKLILEADQQRLYQAKNLALPTLDAIARYRWNGLEGEMPNGRYTRTDAGQFTDWTVGVNFSVPLGLRQGRAAARQSSILISRDRANIQQQMHQVIHDLAGTIRDLDSAYEQYLVIKETREAAYNNLKVQLEEYRARRVIFLNVLQALNDWGNAVSSQARALTLVNVTLATLERQTGTILDTHNVYFTEERFCAAGPLGLFGQQRLYPEAMRPIGGPTKYPTGAEPAENAFDLKSPVEREKQ